MEQEIVEETALDCEVELPEVEWEVIKQPHTWPREYYEGNDDVAKKLRLTKNQYERIQLYLKTGNAAQAIRDARGGEIKPWDAVYGNIMKNNTRINAYIQETAETCMNIQFEEIIKNGKAPFSVRNDAIKDRLDRAWIWKKFDNNWLEWNTFIWDIKITIDS